MASVVATGTMLTIAACAPNSVRTPLEAGLDPSLARAEAEESRYGTLLRLASSTRAAGDSATAVNIYQQAIKLEHRRPEAFVLLGETMIELEEYDEAAKLMKQVLDRDKNNLLAQRGYGRVMIALNRPESAILHYERALKTSPNDIRAANGLAVAFDLSGRHKEAQKTYRDALALSPDSILLRNNLGLSLALSGQHEDSISLLRMVADEPGSRARNRQNLALAYGLAGNLTAAERIGSLDLDQETVKNNVAYFAMLAAMNDERQRAIALGASSPELHGDDNDDHARHRLTALALDDEGLELGLAPTGRWFIDLGNFANDSQAVDAWRRMRSQHKDLLNGLSRLAGIDEGQQTLLVGPIINETRADTLCNTLKTRKIGCTPLAL